MSGLSQYLNIQDTLNNLPAYPQIKDYQNLAGVSQQQQMMNPPQPKYNNQGY